jgi:hypothetical protein
MRMRALPLAAVAASLLLTPGANAAPPAELWSLYLYEQAAEVCGVLLSEDEETELDQAQWLAKLRLGLSQHEAAALYRKARATALSTKDDVCATLAEPDLQVDLRRTGARPG